jgi:hypothetical protein
MKYETSTHSLLFILAVSLCNWATAANGIRNPLPIIDNYNKIIYHDHEKTHEETAHLLLGESKVEKDAAKQRFLHSMAFGSLAAAGAVYQLRNQLSLQELSQRILRRGGDDLNNLNPADRIAGQSLAYLVNCPRLLLSLGISAPIYYGKQLHNVHNIQKDLELRPQTYQFKAITNAAQFEKDFKKVKQGYINNQSNRGKEIPYTINYRWDSPALEQQVHRNALLVQYRKMLHDEANIPLTIAGGLGLITIIGNRTVEIPMEISCATAGAGGALFMLGLGEKILPWTLDGAPTGRNPFGFHERWDAWQKTPRLK